MTQNNLGNALSSQGERSEGAEGARLMGEAITAYRAALSVRTREQLPQDWAITQSNVGVVLSNWGKRNAGAEREKLLIEAVNAFQNVLTFFPSYKRSFQGANSLYHEVLFKFPDAFELKQRWLATHPNDASVLPDFAENHFTTGRFAECRERIAALLAQPQLAIDTKSALRMIEIANLLALGQAQAIPDKLDALIAAVATQPADFKITWTFNGTLHFIGQEEKLSAY
ncbi:MAG: hypothetical protein ABIU20_01480 [Blastocatellia bacterium]